MNTPLSRLLIGFVVGAILGLVYGWLIRPVEYVDTTPDSLRSDYRADYILMVAEAYTAERNLEEARLRLAALGPQPPAEIALNALAYALEQEFRSADTERLERLITDLQSIPPPAEIGGP